MSKNSLHTTDVAIIGGGIIGCSIAWRLAQAGLRVTVLDRAEPGREASSAAAGMLAPVGEMIESQTFFDLCVASRCLYPPFAASVEEASGQYVGYRTEGSLLVALDDHQEEELRQVHHQQTARGFVLQPLSTPEALERAPGLSPQVRGGLFVADDHWVDNERLMRALVEACRRAGVQFEAGHAGREFHTRGSAIDSVTATDGSRIAAGHYVLSAGCWSGEVAGWRAAPLIPCHGQMMELEVLRELPCVVRAGMSYLVPRPDQRLLAGTTAEYRGFERATTANGLLSILAGAVRVAPQVGECRFLRAWAGLRPDTPDHLPILGYGTVQNLLLATGHFRNGILLAPITAEIIADLILKGTTPHPIEAYRPTRFKLSANHATG